MFGAETTGMPPEAHDAATNLVKIPMSEQFVRSLNLATSVGERRRGGRRAPGDALFASQGDALFASERGGQAPNFLPEAFF